MMHAAGRTRFELLGGIKVVELDKGNIGSGRPDDDVLASHYLLSVRQAHRMPDSGRSDDSRELFTQGFQ